MIIGSIFESIKLAVGSVLYRCIRSSIKFAVFVFKHDLETVINFGDRLIKILPFKRFLFSFSVSDKLKTNVHGLIFPSPVMVSSFKFDKDLLHAWSLMGAGGVMIKTILPNVTPGNNRPRIQQVTVDRKPHLFNAMGLPGPGIDVFLEKIRTWGWLRHTHKPIGISVGGHCSEEYVATIVKIEASHKQYPLPFSFFYELNISCPNTPDGANLSKHVDLFESLLQDVRQKTDKVVSVKLSPAQSDEDIVAYAKVIGAFEKMIINVGNTAPTAREQVNLNENTFTRPMAGLSGPALFKRTLEMVSLVSNVTDTPILATGGISTPNDVKVLKKAGATLFGMATALVLDPFVIPDINRTLKKL